MARNGKRGRRGNEHGESDECCCAATLDTLTHPCCCGGVWSQAAALWLTLPRASLTTGHGADPAAPPPRGRLAAAMYRSVRHYRVAVSPTRPPCCSYTPSCSTYAVQALHHHGAFRGGRLILARLLRCRPGAARRRTYRDPVPPPRH